MLVDKINLKKKSYLEYSWALAVFVASPTSKAIATASVKNTSAFFQKIALTLVTNS